jgi:transcription elongation GreA/GreB family factor
MILSQPSNWKLGIMSSDEPISRCLLGRTPGERFEADLDGIRVKIFVTMKHEVKT